MDESSQDASFARVRVELLEVSVTPITAPHAASLVLEHARASRGLVVGNLNLHGVYMFHTDESFRQFCDISDIVLIDGTPIAWLGGLSSRFRAGSTDWLDLIMPVATGLTILAVGGTVDSSRRTAEHMSSEYPGVNWIGVDGFSSQKVGSLLASQIAEADIVLVGMGMPLQERWIVANGDLLVGKVVANVGGCFDYYAGDQKLAPRWMGRLGAEWVFRLICDPKRLGRRYLVEPLKLVSVLVNRRLRATHK